MIPRAAWIVALLIAAPARVFGAQPAACDYDTCALRLDGRGALVAGLAATPVEALIREGRPHPLRTAESRVQADFLRHRRYTVFSQALGWVAGPAVLVLAVHYYDKDRTRWSRGAEAGVPAGIVLAGVGSSWASARADDALRRAVWRYNGPLPRPMSPASAAPDSACPYKECGLRLKSRLGGRRVVRGVDGVDVGRVGRDPAISALMSQSADDSVRAHYQAFRRAHREASRTKTAQHIFLGGIAAALILPGIDRSEDGQAAGGVAATASYIVGCLTVRSAVSAQLRSRDEHEQALWFYNRTLPASPEH